jgi:hypothetical protein
MTDELERRLREGLHEAAAFEPDTAAARTRFDRRRRQRRLRLWTGSGVLAAAGVAALALALAGSAGSGSRVGLTANGGDRGEATTSTLSEPIAGAPGETVPGEPGATTTTGKSSPGVTASPGSTVVGTPGTVKPSPPPGPTTVPPPTTSPPGPGPHTITVTEADSGKSYTLHRGDHMVVQLSGSSLDWTEPASSNDAVLHRTSGSVGADGSAQATFSANAKGQADVTSTGDPPCRKSTPPCMAPSMLFQVSVTVVG